jgi:hypothetical protein
MELEKVDLFLKEVLDFKIGKNTIKSRRSKNYESLFCDRVDENLEQILKDAGFKVKDISIEFPVVGARFDYLIKLENDEYLIIEAKYSNNADADASKISFAVGQLLTYRALFSNQYHIDLDKIKMILLVNEELSLPLYTIQQSKLPIGYLIYGEIGAKYYGW